MKGVDVFIEINYEVIRFVEHGNRCRPAMDYVPGKLLLYRLKRYPKVEKKILFEWLKQLLYQLELYHRCYHDQCYRYLNPYSVLITSDSRVLLLNLEAESNDFVLRNMQKRSMRNHFLKPIVHIRENTKLSLDLYGFGKTIQFILASAKVEPSLTRREEYRLSKIIEKCLGENPKKQYENLKQVKKELSLLPKGNGIRVKKKAAVLCVAVGMLFFWGGTVCVRKAQEKRDYTENGVSEEMESEDGIEEAEGKTEIGILEMEIKELQDPLWQNTSSKNREIIEKGEVLQRELLLYLSTAYDREGMTEQALEAYERLCSVETQPEILKVAYLRRISLEMELQNEGKAFRLAEEAAELFPELKDTDVYQKLKEKYGEKKQEETDEEKDEITDR